MLNLINNYYNYYIMLIKPYIGRIIIKKKGQVLLEYGVILALVISALIGIQIYMQRELQARYKDAADKVITDIRQAKGEGILSFQYEPYYQESDIDVQSSSNISNSYLPDGVSSKTIDYEKTSRKGTQLELPYSDGAGE